MSEEKANQDYRHPMSETFLHAPVDYGSFDDYAKIPIYWGPGQYTKPYPDYHVPDPERWRIYEHLTIPRVSRFIYTNEQTYSKDKYNNEGGGTTPTTAKWVCVRTVPLQPRSDFYQYRVFWEREVNGQLQPGTQVNYVHTFRPTPEAYFGGLTLELAYGEVPNYSNDGAPR